MTKADRIWEKLEKAKLIEQDVSECNLNQEPAILGIHFEEALPIIEAEARRDVLEQLLAFIGDQPQKFNYTELEDDYNELTVEINRQLKELEPK